MTVSALIELLGKADPAAEVKAYDADTRCLESIAGMIHGGRDGGVELLTHDEGEFE